MDRWKSGHRRRSHQVRRGQGPSAQGLERRTLVSCAGSIGRPTDMRQRTITQKPTSSSRWPTTTDSCEGATAECKGQDDLCASNRTRLNAFVERLPWETSREEYPSDVSGLRFLASKTQVQNLVTNFVTVEMDGVTELVVGILASTVHERCLWTSVSCVKDTGPEPRDELRDGRDGWSH